MEVTAMTKRGNKIILHGRGIVGGKGEGSAIVLKKGFALCGIDGIDTKYGVRGEIWKGFAPPELVGVSVKGRVLVFSYGTGSSSGGSCLYRTCKAGYAPAAIINNRLEPITASGAIVANVPLAIGLDQDPCQVIETGDYVTVDGNKGIVEVTKKK
jgi:predicted aconitase with swiveling domain